MANFFNLTPKAQIIKAKANIHTHTHTHGCFRISVNKKLGWGK